MKQTGEKIHFLNPLSRSWIIRLASIITGGSIWILAGDIATVPPSLVSLAVIMISIGLLVLFLDIGRALKSEFDILKVFMPIIAAVGIGAILLLAEHSFRYLFFLWPLDDGEGFCLNQAKLLATGSALYPPIDCPPYIVTNYPPVFPFLLSFFIDPNNVLFFSGRLISVIATIITCMAASRCVVAATGNRKAGWIAGILIAASPVIYFWSALVRVDLLATALGIIGLRIAMTYRGSARYLSVPFVVAALFTRQSSVEAAAAIAVGMLLEPPGEKNGRNSPFIRALIFVVLWTAITVLSVLFLQLWSDGEFWKHTVTYTKTRFFSMRLISNMQWIFQTHSLLLVLALIALPSALKDSKRRMLGIFFIASFGTALLSGKIGSDLNYFLNLIVASACLVGCFAHDLARFSLSGQNRPAWLIPAMILIPATIVHSGLLTGYRTLSFQPRWEDNHNGFLIFDILSDSDEPILSEDEGFCLIAGHEVIFNPFIMSELAREGTWDQTDFVNSIKNREYKIIMLRFDVNNPHHDDRTEAGKYAGWDRFTNEMEEAISENYEINPNIGVIYMRRPWHFYRRKEELGAEVSEIMRLRNLLESEAGNY
ncbi:MAG TPA: hypothetical protein ENN67_05305 [Firmicutes bacterium]|nr:hypothetical protein [Bacillota bacterium]